MRQTPVRSCGRLPATGAGAAGGGRRGGGVRVVCWACGGWGSTGGEVFGKAKGTVLGTRCVLFHLLWSCSCHADPVNAARAPLRHRPWGVWYGKFCCSVRIIPHTVHCLFFLFKLLAASLQLLGPHTRQCVFFNLTAFAQHRQSIKKTRRLNRSWPQQRHPLAVARGADSNPPPHHPLPPMAAAASLSTPPAPPPSAWSWSWS